MKSDLSPAEQLYDAASRGDAEKLHALLAAGVDPNTKVNGTTSLAKACWDRQEEAVSILLSHGANPNIPNDDTAHYPLHKAAARNCASIVKRLLDAEADVRLTNKYGNTPLHEAAFIGGVETLKLLIEKDPSLVFKKNLIKNQMTPAEFAEYGSTQDSGTYLKGDHACVVSLLEDVKKAPLKRPRPPAP